VFVEQLQLPLCIDAVLFMALASSTPSSELQQQTEVQHDLVHVGKSPLKGASRVGAFPYMPCTRSAERESAAISPQACKVLCSCQHSEQFHSKECRL
jgi:hypothetical protein